jgi:HK97 family phage prohead protease
MKKSFVLSDESKINSKGYRIVLSGGDLERFKSNPLMLYMHDDNEVIGKWENIRIDGKRLVADAVFDSSEKAKEVERKVNKGFLRGCSVGIIVKEMCFEECDVVVSEWELLEASIVSIPSDPGAVVLYNDKKEILNFSNNNQKSIQMTDVVFKLSRRTVESLGLDADCTQKDVELAVAEKDKEIETLNAKLKAVEKQRQTDYLTGAVKAGRISEAERLSFEKMAEKGCFDDVKSMIDAKAESATETLADKVNKSTPAAGRETWDYLKWMKEDPKGLAQIKRDNPKEFERLQLTIKK